MPRAVLRFVGLVDRVHSAHVAELLFDVDAGGRVGLAPEGVICASVTSAISPFFASGIVEMKSRALGVRCRIFRLRASVFGSVRFGSRIGSDRIWFRNGFGNRLAKGFETVRPVFPVRPAILQQFNVIGE